MAKQKTLYFLQAYGQLGNQLAVLAHLLAFGIEYNYVIVYPYSNELSENLELARKRNSRIRFNRRRSNGIQLRIISRLLKLFFLNRTGQFLGYLIINKRFTVDKEFDIAKQPDVIIVNDWLFRYYDGIIKHDKVLRNELAFTESVVQKARQKWLSVQSEYPQHTFIGVHVRRGDYATWLDGIHFYDNDTYYKWLVQMSEQTVNPVFVICSNENIHFNNENNLRLVYIKGSPAEDLYLLSCCRYIMGPPSTFSSWSAFLGDKLLLFLRNKDEDARIEKFEKYYIK